MLDGELPNNVHLIEKNGRRIYLVGTAHVSEKSVELVEFVLRAIEPDSVAVELCESRYRALRHPEEWKRTDIVQVIRSGRTLFLLAQLLLAGFQKRIGKKLGVKPGAEMVRAIELSEEIGARIVLADREVSLTLRRTWADLGFWGGFKLVLSLLLGWVSPPDDLDEAEIERLKTKDALEEAIEDFASSLPQVRNSLIDERDRYLAGKISAISEARVVAVVGAGHVPGISRYLDEDIDLSSLETVPSSSPWSKILAWFLPLAILGMIGYGFWEAGPAIGARMVLDFVMLTSGAGFLGALLARSHPLTILVAALAGPIGAAHPLIASGWIAGLAEATLRKPSVADFEELQEEPLTVKLVWRNRVTRVLLIVIAVNLAVSLAMLASGYLLADRLL